MQTVNISNNNRYSHILGIFWYAKCLIIVGRIVMTLFSLTLGQNNSVDDLNRRSGLTGSIFSGFARPVDIEVPRCIDNPYAIAGPTQVKVGVSQEYRLSSTQREIAESVDATFRIENNGVVVNESAIQGQKFSYTFTQPGQIEIIGNIQQGECVYTVTKSVEGYSSYIVYVGESQQFLPIDTFRGNFADKDILFTQVLPGDLTRYVSTNDSEMRSIILDADTMLFYDTEYVSDIDALIRIYDNNQEQLSNIMFFFVATQNKNLFKRVLARYLRPLGQNQIYILEKTTVADFLLTYQSDGGIINAMNQADTVDANLSPGIFFLSDIVDYLIAIGFQAQMIILLLMLGVMGVVVSFFRQVIGFSVFGVYTPLMLGVSLYLFGWSFCVAIITIGVLAKIIVSLITKRIYLLYSAKAALLILFFVILVLISIWADTSYFSSMLRQSFYFIDAFGNESLLIGIIILLLVSDKILPDVDRLAIKKRWYALIQFTIVSVTVYSLIRWDALQSFIFAYPEILLILIGVAIFLGRFSGLQVVEYIRFLPYIRKQREEEQQE